MARVRDMQGVPAQLETLKSDGKRRHIAWCKYSKHLGKHVYECTKKESPYFNIKCTSSRNCDFYVDKRYSE